MRVQRVGIKYLILLIFLVLLLIFNPNIFSKTKSVLFEFIAAPLKLANIFETVSKTRASYIRENTRLKEKSAILALELSRMAAIAQENKRLRYIYDFKTQLPYNFVYAEVIGRLPETWMRTILINKGENNGIKKRMAVCTASGLVGSIAETAPFTSKVMLLADSNSKVGVILEDCRQAGVLIGEEKSECRIIYLSIDSNVRIGERVLTSGFGGLFPKGLTVGRVKETGIDKIRFYRYAIVTLSQDINSLEEVLCIE